MSLTCWQLARRKASRERASAKAPPSESALRELRAEQSGLESGLNGGAASRGTLAASSIPSSGISGCVCGTKDGRVDDCTTATWASCTRGPPPLAESVTASTKPSPCRVSNVVSQVQEHGQAIWLNSIQAHRGVDEMDGVRVCACGADMINAAVTGRVDGKRVHEAITDGVDTDEVRLAVSSGVEQRE